MAKSMTLKEVWDTIKELKIENLRSKMTRRKFIMTATVDGIEIRGEGETIEEAYEDLFDEAENPPDDKDDDDDDDDEDDDKDAEE